MRDLQIHENDYMICAAAFWVAGYGFTVALLETSKGMTIPLAILCLFGWPAILGVRVGIEMNLRRGRKHPGLTPPESSP